MKKLPRNPAVHSAVEQYCKVGQRDYHEGKLYYKIYIGDAHLESLVNKTNGVVYSVKGGTAHEPIGCIL